jgi:hypothetical protein
LTYLYTLHYSHQACLCFPVSFSITITLPLIFHSPQSLVNCFPSPSCCRGRRSPSLQLLLSLLQNFSLSIPSTSTAGCNGEVTSLNYDKCWLAPTPTPVAGNINIYLYPPRSPPLVLQQMSECILFIAALLELLVLIPILQLRNIRCHHRDRNLDR